MRLKSGATVEAHELLAGGVQIRTATIAELGLPSLPSRPDVHVWAPHRYDPRFLGYMAALIDP